MNVKRLLTVTTLGSSLLLWSGSALAQQDGAVINADGTSGTSSAGINPAVDADGPTVVYGDVNTGPGNTVIGPPISGPIPGTAGNVSATDGDAAAIGPGNASAAPGTVTRGTSGTDLLGPDGTYSVTENTPSNVTMGDSGVAAPVSEPVYEPAPVESEPVVADTTATNATSGDQDGDNYPDAQELEIGLDPYNPDTDGDGVADGDEINIYGTDPFYWDTDGDGLGDGQELYELRTDPLAFNGDGAAATETVAAPAPAPETQAMDSSGSASSAGDSDGDRLSDADEAALGTDPGNPDTDGDGYYDGDEAALGTNPHDATEFPAT